MADLQKYGRTANLFDDEIASGYYNDSGVLVSDTTTSHSTTYIPVDGTTYTASGLWYSTSYMSNFAVYEWDNNKNWLRRSNRQYPPSNNEIIFTIGNDTAYITLQIQTNHSNIMLNTGSTALPYQPYYGWQHSLRKLTTATETVENPLYSDGTAITAYNIKGNEEHTGTPSPQNPVMPNGVGERTENIIDTVPITAGSMASMNYENANNSQSIRCYGTSEAYTQRASTRGYTLPAGTYTLSFVSTRNDTRFFVQLRSSDGLTTYASTLVNPTFTLNETTEVYPRVCGNFSSANPYTTDEVISIMLNTGSTDKPYEPYGYKIPIPSGGVTTNIYLGSTQTVRQIKKVVFYGTENWNNSVASDIFGVANLFGTYPFIPQVTALCTEYTYNSRQSGYASGLTSGEFALQKYESGGNVGYTPYFRNNSYTTVDQWKAYLAQQYANGTPVTVWYVLATAETAAVNEPLMKIGDYADTLSNATAIPTTEGANSITVDTTVQPSEFTATWTGWHDASVKEKSENLLTQNYVHRGLNWSDGTISDTVMTNRLTTMDLSDITSGQVTAAVYDANSNSYDGVLLEYDSSGNYTGNYQEWHALPYTWTVESNTKVRICVKRSNNYDIDADNTKIMLNTGSTALPYEPYWK